MHASVAGACARRRRRDVRVRGYDGIDFIHHQFGDGPVLKAATTCDMGNTYGTYDQLKEGKPESSSKVHHVG